MDKRTKVSVVIPFYNCPYVHEAVESVLAQSYENIEIIVVDDGSTIHTGNLAPYLDTIKYIHKAHGGTATALNHGISAASGSYFAWLSSDDRFHPDKIRKQVDLMKREGTSFCHTGFYYINNLGERYSSIISNPFRDRAHQIEIMMKGCPVNGSTVVMSFDILRKVGLFNESLLYTQDYDLWLRILQRYDWSYLEEPLLDYRVHALMGSALHGEEQKREIVRVQESHYKSLSRLLRKERGR
ncbi:glycosyltransferase [Paenibacillus sp. sgz500958]|uniref:glycosyltransferase n=1 Tax=Paenibacillus sp. sgz500958 TaxID=3242475 RepID=UPI0036D381BA